MTTVILLAAAMLVFGLDIGVTREPIAEPASASARSPGSAEPPAAAPVIVDVPSALPDTWRLSVVDRMLLALPPDWGPIGVPGGETGRRDITVVQGENRTEMLHLAVWRGRSPDDVAGGVAEPHIGPGTTVDRRTLRLDGRLVREIVFTALSYPAKGPGGTITFDSRHLVTVLSDGRVVDVRAASPGVIGRATTLGDERRSQQDLVAARLFAMRDGDLRIDPAEVERALASAIGLTDAQLRGSELTGGETTSYRVDGDARTFVYVATYATRRDRMNVDPNEDGSFGATVSWIAPVTHRGVGNAFIVVGARDVNVRYRAIRALDALMPPDARLPRVCDAREYVSHFASVVRSFGVGSYRRVFQLLADDVTWRFEDPRGVWPSNETLRGWDRLVNTFARSLPVVEFVDMDDAAIERDGGLLRTPAGATVRRMDRMVVPLDVEARAICVDGDVRFQDIVWRFGG